MYSISWIFVWHLYTVKWISLIKIDHISMVFFLIFLMRAVDVTTGPAASSSGTWDGKCPDQNAAQVCLASGKVRGAWPGQYNHHVCTTSPRNHTPHHQPVSHQNSAQPRHRPQPAESCGHAGGKMGIKRRGAAPGRPRGAGRVCCGRGGWMSLGCVCY